MSLKESRSRADQKLQIPQNRTPINRQIRKGKAGGMAEVVRGATKRRIRLSERECVICACMDRFKKTATFLASSVVEKGTDPFCRNGPQGAAHKRGLSPFPFRALLR